MEIKFENIEFVPATPKRVGELMKVSVRTASRYISLAKDALDIKKPKILTMKQFIDYFF